MQTTLTGIFIDLESISDGLSETCGEMSRKARKFKAFFRPKLSDLQKKKKKKKKKMRVLFRPISQIQTFERGCFRMGGGAIFHRKSASKAQEACDFACFTSQWGARAPLAPLAPPGYATEYR